MSVIKTPSWVFFNIPMEIEEFCTFFINFENDMWRLLVDNGEVYWHKTLWLTSESLCRFAGLAVEQCESFRHGDKHIMEIDGQERCQEPFFSFFFFRTDR